MYEGDRNDLPNISAFLMEKLIELWAIAVDVWQHGFYGIDIGRIVIALLILAVCLLIRHLFARVILGRIRRWTEGTRTTFDDHAVRAMERPLGFVPVIVGVFLAGEALGPSGLAEIIFTRVIRTMIAFVIFWMLFNGVEPLSGFLDRLEKMFSRSLVQWVVKALKFAVVVVGGATILEIWGIAVGPIIAGFGLIGVAVALGAQDFFKNLIAGLLIIAERRFGPGDWIKVDGVVEGTVELIGFRSTRVRRFDKAPVYVPNADLSDNAVTNFSAMTHRRIYWTIGVEYRTTVPQMREIRDRIEEAILGDDRFAHPPEVATFVHIDSFGDSAINILLYCFTRTTNWGEWLAIKEELAYTIKDIVEGAGSGFAFPSQSIYVESLPTSAPEPFVVPSDTRS